MWHKLRPSDHLRQRLFFPVLDRMLQDLESRFLAFGAQLMTGKQTCDPRIEELLRHLATHYNIHLLPEEIMVANRFLARKDKDA